MYKVFLVAQMMNLELSLKNVLRYMHIHTYAYQRIDFERLKLLRMT